MKILLIYNGFLFENPPYFAQRFSQVCKNLGYCFCAKKNTDFLVINGEVEKQNADAVLFFDKDLTLARALERQGLRLVNSASAIALCDDKQLQMEMLSKHVPIAKTISSPKCYFANEGAQFLHNICKELKFPIIIKEKHGSQGKQVYLANNFEEFKKIYIQKSGQELIFQEFIEESRGRDIRIFVAFGKILGAIERKAVEGEFRANSELGSVSAPYHPSAEQIELSLQCAHILGLKICGVDLLFSENGNIVCEVNASPGFMHMEKTLGLDIAEKIIEKLTINHVASQGLV